jgi:hypothetical protein
MKTGIDVSTSPFLHFTFLAFYILIHERKIVDAKRSWENMIELIKLDLLLFLPICYTNFKVWRNGAKICDNLFLSLFPLEFGRRFISTRCMYFLSSQFVR